MGILNVLGCYFGIEPELKRVVGSIAGSMYSERGQKDGRYTDQFDERVFGVDYSGFFFEAEREQCGEFGDDDMPTPAYRTKRWTPVMPRSVPPAATAILVRLPEQKHIEEVPIQG